MPFPGPSAGEARAGQADRELGNPLGAEPQRPHAVKPFDLAGLDDLAAWASCASAPCDDPPGIG